MDENWNLGSEAWRNGLENCETEEDVEALIERLKLEDEMREVEHD